MIQSSGPRLTLFEPRARSGQEPKGYAEPSYTYLDRSARPDSARVRSMLEEWFARFPDAGKGNLHARLRSDREDNFAGAFFELYCATLLARQGFGCEPHPVTKAGKDTRPDFRASQADKPAFYLESTVARARDPKTEERLERLYDHLNRLQSPDFLLDVRVIGDVPTGTPPIRQIHQELRAWLDTLDADVVTAEVRQHGYHRLPTRVVNTEGWCLEFDAMPLLPQNGGVVGGDRRIVGSSMHVPASSWVDMQQPLLSALLAKRPGKYGVLDLPYIIAVNVQSEPLDNDHVAAALFGKEAVTVDRQTDTWALARIPGGFWTTSRGAQNTRVSAVFVVSLLEPYTVTRAQPVLWHNPWAVVPLAPEPWSGPQMLSDRQAESMVARDGQAVWETLGLDPAWPM